MQTLVAILISGALALMPSYVLAQGEEDALEDLVIKGAKRPNDAKGSQGLFSPPDIDEKRLEVQWGFYRAATAAPGRQAQFDKAMDMAATLGLVNQPVVAVSLLVEAQEMLQNGDRDGGKALIARAARVAPDLPAVAFARARYGGFFSIGSLIEAWPKAWSFLPSRMSLIGYGALTYTVFLALFAAMLALIVLCRHLRLLSGDLTRLVPRGVSTLQAGLFVLIGLSAALLLSGSPLLVLVLVLVVFAAYMSWSERGATLLVLALLALLPDAASLGQASYEFVGSDAFKYASWSHTGCGEECLEFLEAKRAAPSKDEDARFVRARKFLTATAHLRRGDRAGWDRVRRTYEELDKDPKISPEVRGAVHNNLGVTYAVLEDLERAQESLRSAAKMEPSSFAPYINLSRVLENSEDPEGAKVAFQHALDIGSDAAANRAVEQRKVVALYFETLSLPTESVFLAHIDRVSQMPRYELPYWSLVAGTLPADQLHVVCFTSMGVSLVLIFLGGVLRRARRCPGCGQHMIPKGNGDRGEVEGVCRTCHNCYEGGGHVEYQAQVVQDARVARYALVSKWVFRAGNALGLGLGSSLKGSRAGLWVGALGLLGFTMVLAAPWAPPEPWRLIPLYDNGLQTVGFAFIALGVFLSMLLLLLGLPAVRRARRSVKKTAKVRR